MSAAASPDADALLCALVLAPRSFSRNRFFALFEAPEGRKVRRRAKRVRGILRQLLAGAEVTGEAVLADGRRLLRYRMLELGWSRTASLSPLESAALRYALGRAKGHDPEPADRALVERALERLGAPLGLLPEPPESNGRESREPAEGA